MGGRTGTLKQTSKPSQRTTETFTTSTQTVEVEIIWALKDVVYGFPNNSDNDIFNCFCAMFPDYAFAEHFSLGRTKSSYVVNQDLSLYFKEMLAGNVNLSDCLRNSFDERFNSVTQPCEMNIIICYWETQAQNVRVCYWFLGFLGHTMNKDLLNKIENGASILNRKNLKQI